MRKGLIMGIVAVLAACAGAAIAIVSFIQKKKCNCDDCCCDDEVELYNADEGEISDNSDDEEKDESVEVEEKDKNIELDKKDKDAGREKK